MENKYLQVRKENIFTRFVNFIRGIFGKKVVQEVPTQVEKIENNDIKSNFFDDIKIEKEENKELIELQTKYENNEINLAMLSDKEIDELDLLYKRQVTELKKKLEDRRTLLNIIKHRMGNYSTNS